MEERDAGWLEKCQKIWKRKTDDTIYKIVIAGAGASGMMAAVSAAKELGSGEGILLLEKNEAAGKKLLATGNGRCNFTNARCTSWDYSGAFLNKKASSGFPEGVLYQAPPKRIMEEFARMGIVSREEEDGRVYPYSGRGVSVCRALLRELERLGVGIRYKSALKKLEPLCQTAERLGGKQDWRDPDDADFALMLEDGSSLVCRRLILATGGKAGLQYGSQGDGYGLAKMAGHTIIKPVPALVQMSTDHRDFPRLKGVRAKGRVLLYRGEEKIAEDTGEIQFTEDALSGICIFNLSRCVRYEGNPMDSGEKYSVKIDFMPGFTAEGICGLLRARRQNLAHWDASLFLEGLVHENLSAVLMKSCGAGGGKVGDLLEEQLKSLSKELKGFYVKVTGTKSWKDAQVTAGGVDTDEVERKTLESRRISGLYFAGELLDVDAPCGGYNLQWAFASGIAAGKAAAQSLAEEERERR